MAKRKRKDTIDRIIDAMKLAIAEVYEEARKSGREFVIADKNGRIKKIKVK